MTTEPQAEVLPMAKDPTNGRFLPGHAGTGGRKPGSKNRKTLFLADLDQRAQEKAQTIVDKLIEKAEAGDLKAIELYLARVWVPPRSRKLPGIKLPNITTSEGLSLAYQAVSKALTEGIIDPDEAAKIVVLLDAQRKNLEDTDTQKRMKAIEEKLRLGDAGGQ